MEAANIQKLQEVNGEADFTRSPLCPDIPLVPPVQIQILLWHRFIQVVHLTLTGGEIAESVNEYSRQEEEGENKQLWKQALFSEGFLQPGPTVVVLLYSGATN